MAGAGELKVGPVPKWVNEHTRSFDSQSASADNGLEYLFYDEQVRLESKEDYRHFAYKIVSQAGLSDGAQVELPFDPSYESLTLHCLKVWRGGRATDRTDAGKFQIIQQEKELDRQIYNGKRTALCFLDDIRVGDVVEVAVTKQGDNPIFGQHYADEFDVSWDSPVKEQLLRIIPRAGQQLTMHWLGGKPDNVQEKQIGNGAEYSWQVGAMPADVSEDRAPGWFVQHPYLQVSDFKSWAEVVDWALPLYEVPNGEGKLLQDEIARLQSGPGTTEDKAVAAIDFVQKEVRYLGMEMGGGSHRPSPPELVLERRFGDCKDKALLLASLLRQLGVEAYPVLVNSDWNGRVAELLPSPYAFDHAITLIVMNGKSYLIDATAGYQAGKHLSDRHMGIYGSGLVLRKGETDLTKFELGSHDQGGIEIEEKFVVKDYESPVIYTVVSTFKGEDADSNRSMLADKSATEIAKNFRDYYAHSYPGIQTDKPIEVQDDTDRNVLRIKEYYTIDKFFEPVAKNRKKISAEVDTPYLFDHLPQVNDKARRSPLALAYPLDLQVTTRIEFFEDWDMPSQRESVNGPGFKYQYSEANDGKQVIVRKHHLTSQSEVVPLSAMSDYSAKRREISENSVMRFTSDPTVAANHELTPEFEKALNRINWWWVIGGALAVVVGFVALVGFVIYKLTRRPQPPPLPR